MPSTQTEKKACEYNHAGSAVSCDGTAEFVLYAHKRRKNICGSAARLIWSLGRQACIECRHPKWTHWETVEIKEVLA